MVPNASDLSIFKQVERDKADSKPCVSSRLRVIPEAALQNSNPEREQCLSKCGRGHKKSRVRFLVIQECKDEFANPLSQVPE